ncbi:MAG: short-chain dehydrogenase [Chthonomonas sp.]
MTETKFAIVIGASSGIGRELAIQLAEAGCRVAAVARRADRLQELEHMHPGQIVPVAHDVRDYESVPDLFVETTGRLGGLDAVFYCSGVMPEVGPTEFDFAKDRSVIEVNVLGAVAWLNEAATRFQNTKSGTIVGIGSVAGERGRVGQPVYNASKAFLHAYLEALRNRLSKHGVTVTTIKPGPVQTEMTARLNLSGAMPAKDAARLILAKAPLGRDCFLKPTHRLIFWIIRNFPTRLFRRLKV